MANLIILQCARCGQDFSVNKARSKTAKFCSMACYNPPVPQKSCIVCGDLFTPHYMNRENARYCSLKCKAVDCRDMGGYCPSAKERFLASVDKNPGHGPNGDCWIWTAKTRDKDGYGRFIIKGKVSKTHRFSYEMHNGGIPEGAFVCHSCDNRLCVNPAHLWLGDARSNTHDMIAKGRDRHLIGQDVPMAKLTDEQARSILADPRQQKIIASEYGVSRSTICMLKKRKVWKHLTLDDSSVNAAD